MDKLKPCPFCGGEAKMNRTTRSMVIPEFRVFCAECGANIRNWREEYFKVDYFDNEQEAIEAWNKRAEPYKGES